MNSRIRVERPIYPPAAMIAGPPTIEQAEMRDLSDEQAVALTRFHADLEREVAPEDPLPPLDVLVGTSGQDDVFCSQRRTCDHEAGPDRVAER